MGVYINPTGQTKEEWLIENAQEIPAPQPWTDENKEQLLVVLVDNGPFTAAAVCYSRREQEEFTNGTDYRRKRYFLAPTAKLLDVSPDLKSCL